MPTLTRALVLGSTLTFATALPLAADDGRTVPGHPRLGRQEYGRLPLQFEPSPDATPADRRFVARGAGYLVALAPDGARLDVTHEGAVAASVRLQVDGGRLSAPVPEARTGVTHYYVGASSSDWRTNVPTYGRVRYRAVYPGIDLVYYGNQRRLEYDFEIAPGADWRAVGVTFAGADRVRVDGTTGELVLDVGGREVRQPKPFSYQGSRNAPDVVESRYVVQGRVVRFDVGAYDATRPLVIDPVIVYSTFLGGTGDDTAYGVAVDATGAAYIVGETGSANFPQSSTHTGAAAGGTDVFVAKLTPAGDGLAYTTFLGGSSSEQGRAIVLDADRNAYITGHAGPGFPTTTGVVQPAHATGAGRDAFVAKLSPTGTLVYSTYLGGEDGAAEQANDIAVRPDGSVVVVGATRSRNFPMSNALYPTNNGYYSDTALAFVSRLNPAGTQLVFSTYLGVRSGSSARGVALDGTGAIVVAGYAGGIPTGTEVVMDFPVKDPLRPGYYGGPFVTKLAADGSALVFSTVIGDATGGFGGSAEDVAVDADGAIYITGATSGGTVGGTPLSSIPTVSAFQSDPLGRLDAFVMKIDAKGEKLVYSTYLGGGGSTFDSGNEVGRAIAVDGTGRAYVIGYSSSEDYPLVHPLQLGTQAGPWDAFVTRLDTSGCAIGYSTLFGGGNTDDAFGLAVNAAENVYVVGDTASGDFPLVSPFQAAHRGGAARNFGGRESDAFIMKLAPVSTQQPFSRCDVEGGTQVKPLPPTGVTGNPPVYRFFDQSALWFDPPIATGYKYTMTGSALFTAVLDFPTDIDADNRFTISVEGVVLGEFGPSQPVRFSHYASQLGVLLVNGVGVKNFNVSGIAPALETEDPLAFPIQLEFDVARAGFTMEATTDPVPVTPSVLTFARASQRVIRRAGQTVLTVTRGGDTTSAVAVNYATAAGTATAGSDFTASSGTVSFAAGQTSTTISVPVGAGSGNASLEAFTVTLSSPTGGSTLGAIPTATVELLADNLLHTQYFAEGATGSFFDTRIALLNPTGVPAEVLFSFQRADAVVIRSTMTLAAGARATVRPATIAGLETAEFSTRIDSEQPIVADRTMFWDKNGYGSHAETAVPAPAATWYFAEGATFGAFDLFYLLHNPGDTASTVEVTYLLPAPAAPVVKTYTVDPGTRFTIWADTEDPRLAAADMGATMRVIAGSPIIAERSMYRSTSGMPFAAGHNSAGVTAPATSWFLAEGATGPYFDLFILLANSGMTDANVDVRYLLPDGSVIQRSHVVAAQSRSNIWVDKEDPRLADAAVSTIIESTNAVPIVVDRAMWWPGAGSTWFEAHASAGATDVGTAWALAEGEVGGAANVATYILLANTSAFDGSVRVTLRFEDGSSATKAFPVTATSRFNVDVKHEFPTSVGKRFGAIVESLGSTPAQLVVERALYSDAGGVKWAAGSNSLGTRLMIPQ